MKKWKVIAPLAMTAAGAIATGIAVLLSRTEETKPAAAGIFFTSSIATPKFFPQNF